MRRRVVNFASLLSLLLCSATVVMWFVSYLWPHVPPSSVTTAPAGTTITDHGLFLEKGWIGYQRKTWHLGPYEATAEGPSFKTPIWVLTVIFGAATIRVIPVKHVFHSIRTRSTKDLPGHCHKCGYSLTGNTSGVCPECGKAVHEAPPL